MGGYYKRPSMPNNLSKKLKPDGKLPAPEPAIFNLAARRDRTRVNKLLKHKPRVIDTYDQQLKELFILRNPALHITSSKFKQKFADFQKETLTGQESWQAGRWIYLSWRHTLIHLLEDKDYQTVRTGRNRHLITPNEQEIFYNSTIGIAGLSVGNSIALSIVLSGGGRHIKLADPDTLELTNINRIRTSLTEITEPKVYLTARQIYELDPYADIQLFTAGITSKNINDFCHDLDIIIDEIDNLPIKIELRKQARKHKIPLVMATDNGDSGIIDIERHDQSSDIKFFHGRAGPDIEQQVKQPLPPPVVGRIIGEKLIGYDLIEPRLQKSLLEIGQTIPTWPQLGTTTLLNGAAVAVAIRRILTNQPVINNRAVLSLSSWLIPDYNHAETVKQRTASTQEFSKQYENNIEAFLKLGRQD